MKHILLIILSVFFGFFGLSQTVIGNWSGALNVQGIQLRIVFHITKNNNSFTASLDSPDQGAFDLPVDSIFFNNPELKLKMLKLGAEYSGNYNAETDEINGYFKQTGQEFTLNLKRSVGTKKRKKRYQEPDKPYPYVSEDVVFENKKAHITLAGTLTLPKQKGKFPAVILISGSGAQNRDEKLLGHKPFLIIADYLTRKGIAVLRYDDRGTAKSGGNFKSATSADFADDAEAALNYLLSRSDIQKNKIGLIGHSEGGLIAPMLAAKDSKVAFIVMLAGPGLPGEQILLMQSQLIGKANGASEKELKASRRLNKKIYSLLKTETDTTVMKEKIKSILKTEFEKQKTASNLSDETINKLTDSQITTLTSPWFRYFLTYNPTEALEHVNCPVLALFGEKDLQVPPEADEKAVRKSLKKGRNNDFKTIILPNLNHLFQECKTGSPSEYAKIEQTFSPLALKEISDWIQAHLNK